MTEIKIPNLWCFYGFYFSEKIRKVIEQKLVELEKGEMENDNWSHTNIHLYLEGGNKLVFIFDFEDGNTKQVEFEMEEKVFFFKTILPFVKKIEHHRINPAFVCLGVYFFVSEKKPLQEYLSGLQKALESV